MIVVLLFFIGFILLYIFKDVENNWVNYARQEAVRVENIKKEVANQYRPQVEELKEKRI